jgi:hypothetical protein
MAPNGNNRLRLSSATKLNVRISSEFTDIWLPQENWRFHKLNQLVLAELGLVSLGFDT